MKIHRVSALIGCFAVIGVLTLFLPQQAEAVSKYARHVACNEAWRASPAAEWQQCTLRSVHWDSFRPGLQTVHRPNLQKVMEYSRCWVHVKCDYGTPLFPRGEHWGKINYTEVHKLRRCSSDPRVVNSTCESLTMEEVHEGWEEYRAQSSQSANGNQHNGCGSNSGGC